MGAQSYSLTSATRPGNGSTVQSRPFASVAIPSGPPGISTPQPTFSTSFVARSKRSSSPPASVAIQRAFSLASARTNVSFGCGSREIATS